MFAGSKPGRKNAGMLRKVMWSGLVAGLGAVEAVITRQLATKIWRVVTGEDPPARK
jgi:hypothetical protein